MFIIPVPKESGHFMLVSQNQQKSFILTYLEDFKKNPLSANPYLVITCFDELARQKGIALIRGDIVGAVNKEEGQTILNMLLNYYLVDSYYQTVRQFNHQPSQFNYEQYTQEGIQEFKTQLDIVRKTTPPPSSIPPRNPQTWKI